jgi:UPF0755 protein
LYGDGGWEGQQAHAGQQSPYGGLSQHHPQQPQQAHQPQYGEWGHGQQPGYDGQHPHYDVQGQQSSPQHDQYGQQQYGQPGQEQYGQHAQQQYGQQYAGQPHQQYQQGGGWDGTDAQPQVPYPGDPVDAYGRQQAHGAEQADPYGTPDAYPPPEPPNRRRPEPEPRPDPDPESGPDREEHPFFAGGGEEDDDPEADDPAEARGRADRKGRDGKVRAGKKRRSGTACLVVVLVLGGGVSGVGYFGYHFYQSRFAAAPDYDGNGTGETVSVTIPPGADGYAIGRALKKAGVVKSVDAFVTAQANNPASKSIQAGSYTLNEHMSAAAAVELMLSPKSKSNLIIAEGWRNAKIYQAIDERLKLEAGTTKAVAGKEWKTFGLPDWADTDQEIKDPLEGFLYPSSYPVSQGMKPEDLLKQMVERATEKYAQLGLQGKAEALHLDDPLQILTVASLVQAEGKYKHDFEKVATVVYNRLKPYPDNDETAGRLEFDSTVNYLRGESKLATGAVNQLRQIDDPYNTYRIHGLPPGPIDNPGQDAIEAALHPAKGNWYYFVSVNENETLFAETNAEQNRNREKYEEEQKKTQ